MAPVGCGITCCRRGAPRPRPRREGLVPRRSGSPWPSARPRRARGPGGLSRAREPGLDGGGTDPPMGTEPLPNKRPRAQRAIHRALTSPDALSDLAHLQPAIVGRRARHRPSQPVDPLADQLLDAANQGLREEAQHIRPRPLPRGLCRLSARHRYPPPRASGTNPAPRPRHGRNDNEGEPLPSKLPRPVEMSGEAHTPMSHRGAPRTPKMRSPRPRQLRR